MREHATPPAPLFRRFAAMLYESLLLLAVVFIVAYIATAFIGEVHTLIQKLLMQLVVAGSLYLYSAHFWMRTGQTLAMKTWRIRIETRDGQRLDRRRANLRFLLAWPSILFFGAGLLWAFFDRDRQFLHDRLAGTRIVRTDL
jgi:uncharacterized RDD family membrane protein YckC